MEAEEVPLAARVSILPPEMERAGYPDADGRTQLLQWPQSYGGDLQSGNRALTNCTRGFAGHCSVIVNEVCDYR